MLNKILQNFIKLCTRLGTGEGEGNVTIRRQEEEIISYGNKNNYPGSTRKLIIEVDQQFKRILLGRQIIIDVFCQLTIFVNFVCVSYSKM